MKIEVETQTPIFKPVRLVIDLTTQEEVNDFFEMGCSQFQRSEHGTSAEALGKRIKDSLADYAHE